MNTVGPQKSNFMHGFKSAISDFLKNFEQNQARPKQIVAQDSRAS